MATGAISKHYVGTAGGGRHLGRSAPAARLPSIRRKFHRRVQFAEGLLQGIRLSAVGHRSRLGRQKYGFTVEADGRLKVLDSASRLSSSDTQRLTDLLNQSPVLKAYRNASIDTVDADSVWSGLGYYSLTNENFAKTIDLAPLLRDFDPSDIKGPRPINWPTKASGRRKKRKWRCMSGVQRSGSVRRADPLCVVRKDGVQAAVDTQNHYMGFWSIRLWSAGLHRYKKSPPTPG
ncbi:hypothetical protein L9Z73_19005 [Pseudomonas sp. TNT11]|uniref:Uncharacterized protein n=1 Tax=Pseudomonas emilianonis TaxID=2915812 RepID=A0ABT0EKV5_9PSED|nr:hypothetical protein [Pseudomonas emilianonis]MCK1786363.1 hypothetical protein [Pseudomonas emilianonis]